MDTKDFEKMFEIIVSLEPTDPRPIAQSNQLTIRKLSSVDIEHSPTFYNSRKPSMSLAVSAPSARRGSVDTRKSLFHNERNQADFNRSTLCRANSRSTLKVPQEIDAEDDTQNLFLTNYRNEPHVYETVSIPIKASTLDTGSINDQSISTQDTVSSSSMDSDQQCDIKHRKSLTIMSKNELRQSNHSENACHQRNIDDNAEKIVLQSAPESARESVSTPSIYFTDNKFSLDSGVDHALSINLRSSLSNEAITSTGSFSDISEFNINPPSDKEIFETNDITPECHTWIENLNIPASTFHPNVNSAEPPNPKIISGIKSEEEQNKFFRMISSELTLNSFSTKEIIKFYTRNGTFSSQIIDQFQTASSMCNILKKKYIIKDDAFCQIIEVIQKESLERPLEDHEKIIDIFSSWKNDNYQNKFVFQENPGMYKIFLNPSAFVDEMKYDFEITDTLWIRGHNSKWIRPTCLIRDTNIYYTIKHGSKDNKDLNSLVDLRNVHFYTCVDLKKIKKEYKAPTMEVIVFKENKLAHKKQDNCYLAATNAQQKEKWLEAMKVAKYSFEQLKKNYLECQMCFPSGFRSQANSDVTIEGSENYGTLSSS